MTINAGIVSVSDRRTQRILTHARKVNRTKTNKYGFVAFTEKIIKELRTTGRERRAEIYVSTMRSLMRFWKEMNFEEMNFEEMNTNLLAAYESFLKHTGCCANTTSFYMRSLRAIYNRAVKSGIACNINPFTYVYTGIAKTSKRAIPLNLLHEIKELNLSDFPNLQFARDIFLFSFYTRGMSFVDICFLTKKNLHNGNLIYKRSKTSQRLVIHWEKPMETIVQKYAIGSTPYLLPLIHDPKGDLRKQYLCASHSVNHRLKKIGEMLGMSTPLTMYVARHTWASIAKNKHIPLSVISEALGHTSERTTQIYLAALESTSIDKANRTIINSI